MKLVIQRVKSASVETNGKTVGEIGKGLFVLLGISDEDTEKKAEQYAEKLSKMRIMADSTGKMNLSVLDTKSSILVVSQFTLYSDTTKGNRPSFIKAGNPKQAEKIYNHFIEQLQKCGINVATGVFGAYMKINANLDGPVTIILD